MNWRKHAIEDLSNYKFMKLGILNSKERLAIMNSGIKASLPVIRKRGSQSSPEFMNCKIEANKLRQSISLAQSTTRLIERALDSLTEPERRILSNFYMDSSPKPANVLSVELGFSVRSLYRARDEALAKFTLAMYGSLSTKE